MTFPLYENHVKRVVVIGKRDGKVLITHVLTDGNYEHVDVIVEYVANPGWQFARLDIALGEFVRPDDPPRKP